MKSEIKRLSLVRANGVNIYYKLNGEHGSPLVLLHGSWVDHHSWDPVVPGLSRGFRVLSYDRRGHSQSEKITTQGSFDEDADDAAALMTQLGLVPAHVVGNSGGSSIALKLAAKQPSVFRSLVVHEPPLLGLLGDDPAFFPMLVDGRRKSEAVASLIEKGDMAGGARLFAETLAFGPGGWDRLPPHLKETYIINAPTFLDETKDEAGLHLDLKGLARFRKPALLTYGGKSLPHFRPIIEKLANVIPGSRVSIYSEARHTPHISHPEEFVRTVTDFAKSSE